MNRRWLLIALILVACPQRLFAQSISIKSKVTAIEGRSFILDKGFNAGIESKMIFDVYEDARVVRLPLTDKDETVYVSQKVVARLIVQSVQDNQCKAGLYGAPKKPVKVGLTVIYNPSVKAGNQKPKIESVKPAPETHFSWRQRVDIELQVINEPEDDVLYEWRCQAVADRDAKKKQKMSLEGGIFTSKYTVLPTNTWICPPLPGKYRISVTATDSVGQKGYKVFEYFSDGVKDSLGSRVSYQGLAVDPKRFVGIRDIAFDTRGAMYVLQAGVSGTFGGVTPSIKVLEADGRLTASVDLPAAHKDASRMTLTPYALYLMDSDTMLIKRFTWATGRSLGSTLSSKPTVFGGSGAGNGKFQKPVDMVVNGEGHVVVLDNGKCEINVFKRSGVFLYSLGMRGRGEGQMMNPVALSVARDGRMFCLDDGRKQILVFEKGRFQREISLNLRGRLSGLGYDPVLNTLAIANSETGKLRLLKLEGNTSRLLLARAGGRIERSMRELIKLQNSGLVRATGTASFVVIDREGASLAKFNATDTVNYSFLGRYGGVSFGDGLKVAASPKGELVVLRPSYKTLWRVRRDGWIDLSLDGNNSRAFKFKSALDVAVGETGQIHVLDNSEQCVFQFTSSGVFRRKLGTNGSGPSKLTSCLDLECSGLRESLVILQERKSNNIFRMSELDGKGTSMPRREAISDPIQACEGINLTLWIIDDETLGSIKVGSGWSTTSTNIEDVKDMSSGIDGHFYIAETDSGSVQVFNMTGAKLGAIKNKAISEPKDLALDNYGRVYVYDGSSEAIHLFSNE